MRIAIFIGLYLIANAINAKETDNLSLAESVVIGYCVAMDLFAIIDSNKK